jgi:long-chain acyl-CoA synthetase
VQARDLRVVPWWPDSNLAGLLTAAVRARPEHAALVDGHRRLSWRELAEECAAVACGLSAMGLVAGHRVALLLGNRAEFVTTYLGAVAGGLVAVPMNPASVTGEVVRLLADAQARVVVCDPDTVTSARAAVAGLTDALVGADDELRARTVVPRIVTVDAPALPGETTYADLSGAAAASGTVTVPPSPQDPETLAVLLYTAGTSGRPRAAMLPHRALLANIAQAAAVERPPLDPDDRVLGLLPLFHVYGLNAVLGQVLRQAACLVLTERFHAEQTLALVAAETVTNVPVAPPVLAAWSQQHDLRERLASVRTVLVGAGPLAPEVAKRFEEASGLTVHQGYGLTEAGPVVTTTLAGPTSKPGSVGRPLPGVEIKIVDADGEATDPQDPGEILVRGPNLFCGYWPDGHGAPQGDGWFGTGDVGYVDDEGDLFLLDRLQEVVVVSGFNVYPAEVEEAIAEVAGVDEVAVVGIEDPGTGESVVAYVVGDRLTGLSAERLTEEVRAHCRARLAPYKRPRDVHVVDALPHAVNGKVAKGRLRSTQRRRAMGLT